MKRRTATVAAAATFALVLAGCGSSGPSSAGASATMWGLSGDDEPTINSSIERWNAGNEDQAIAIDTFANDAFKTKVRTAIGAGDAPTFIYGWGGGVLRDYVDAGQVEDLTAFVDENPEVVDRYIDSVLQNGVIDGKTYALPNNKIQPVVLYLNRAVFDEAGVDAPETWDDLMDLVETFSAEGVTPLSLGGQSKWPNLMWLQYLTDRIGGPEAFQRVLDNEPDAWSDPAIIEALTKIQELVDAGAFGNGFSSVAADSGADQALLYTGKAAMLLQGAWAYQGMKADAPDFVADGSLEYVPFPVVEGGEGDPANLVGNPTNFWSVSAEASDEAKDAAEAYLKDGLFDDEYIDGVIESGAVPVVEGVEDRLAASEDADFLTFAYDMAIEAPHFQLSWDQALSSSQADAMLTNLDQIFLGQQTPEQFADAMNATLETE